MRRLLALSIVLFVAACDEPPPQRARADASQIRTIHSVAPSPLPLDPPPMLVDEAPPPKPKLEPFETPKTIVFTPEDEKLRANLPFSPAIAMDPIDGSKISMRATTPTFEYKGKIYYFSNEANRRTFMANPEAALKSGALRL